MRDKNFFTKDSPSDIDEWLKTLDSPEWQKYLNTAEIQAWIDDFQNQTDYEDFMIKEHLAALRSNSLANDNKAKWIRFGQLFFVLAVSVIPVILLALLIGFSSGILKVE